MTDAPDFPPRLAAEHFDPQPWADDAECRLHDPEAWFPGTGEHGYMVRIVESICQRCPVRVECLQYALDAEGPLHGIWAGTHREQRAEWSREGISAVDALYPVDEEAS